LKSFLDMLENRVSLRRYKDKDIKPSDLNKIIHSAMRAPTAGNLMHYSILVIKNKEKKKILSESCDNQSFIAQAPVILIFLADLQRMYDYFEVCDLKKYCENNNMRFKNPNLASLFLGAGDAFIAAQNAVIAAESLGIGSCYIGDLIENYELKKDLFNLSQYTMPLVMLTFGYYPDDFKKRKSNRFNKEYIVFKEEYRRLDEKELIDMYKRREERIRPDNKLNAENFGQYIYKKKIDSKFFEEMERSLKLMVIDWLENRE